MYGKTRSRYRDTYKEQDNDIERILRRILRESNDKQHNYIAT